MTRVRLQPSEGKMSRRYTLDKSGWPLIINEGGAVTKTYNLPRGSSGTDIAAVSVLARAYRDLKRLNSRKRING